MNFIPIGSTNRNPAALARLTGQSEATVRRAFRESEAIRQRPPRPQLARTATPPVGELTENQSAMLRELRASKRGRELGQQYAHDPVKALHALASDVRHVPRYSLQLRATAPGIEIFGMTLKGEGVVWLATGLPRAEAEHAAAHELGHVVLANESEHDADCFARAFLAAGA